MQSFFKYFSEKKCWDDVHSRFSPMMLPHELLSQMSLFHQVLKRHDFKYYQEIEFSWKSFQETILFKSDFDKNVVEKICTCKSILLKMDKSNNEVYTIPMPVWGFF